MKRLLTISFLLIFHVHIYAQGLIIPENGNVVVNGGSLALKNNLVNDGKFIHNNGVLHFIGDEQYISGTSSVEYKNLSVADGSTTSVLSSGNSVKYILKSDGILNADGNITLLSTPVSTALIDGTGQGEILGNVIMQRYLDTAYGYKYLSSPFTDATVNSLSDELDLNAEFPPLYRFDESSSSSGWYYYINPSSPLLPLNGYAAHFGNGYDSMTIDIAGEVNNGFQTINLNNNNEAYTEGYNLVGNPYPSPIDWDAVSGWTRNNIDDAIYFYKQGATDEYTGTYSSYINGVSSDGVASNIIPSMQGFFVHVSDGTYPVSATLSMDNSVRVNNHTQHFFKKTLQQFPTLRLVANNLSTSSSDPLVIYLHENATQSFEPKYDALKILNTDKDVPNLYAVSKDGYHQSIYSTSISYNEDYTIPLSLNVQTTGEYSISLSDIIDIPFGVKAYFIDNYAKMTKEISTGFEYSTLLDVGNYTDRFYVVFSRNEVNNDLINSTELNAYFSNGRIYVYISLATGVEGAILITNASGQTHTRQQVYGLGYKEFPAPSASGVYVISFLSEKGVFSKKLFIDGDK